jgi:hypothetical protein
MEKSLKFVQYRFGNGAGTSRIQVAIQQWQDAMVMGDFSQVFPFDVIPDQTLYTIARLAVHDSPCTADQQIGFRPTAVSNKFFSQGRCSHESGLF